MNAPRRWWLATLRSLQRLPAKYLPLCGMCIGLGGACVYWLAAQLWPSSVALILALSTIAGLGNAVRDAADHSRVRLLPEVFILFVEFNTLLALSSAELPFTLPANVGLGLIMFCGQSVSYGLLVSVLATGIPAPARTPLERTSPPTVDTGLALALGFAPATLLGIPGLVGLAGAVALRLGLAADAKSQPSGATDRLHIARQLGEATFYLGALAAWKYI